MLQGHQVISYKEAHTAGPSPTARNIVSRRTNQNWGPTTPYPRNIPLVLLTEQQGTGKKKKKKAPAYSFMKIAHTRPPLTSSATNRKRRGPWEKAMGDELPVAALPFARTDNRRNIR